MKSRLPVTRDGIANQYMQAIDKRDRELLTDVCGDVVTLLYETNDAQTEYHEVERRLKSINGNTVYATFSGHLVELARFGVNSHEVALAATRKRNSDLRESTASALTLILFGDVGNDLYEKARNAFDRYRDSNRETKQDNRR